jgi:integrase
MVLCPFYSTSGLFIYVHPCSTRFNIVSPGMTQYGGTAHTCRRTFATIAFKEDGLPLLEIAKLTGHTSEKNLLKYIKVTPEEAANHLRAIWARKKR